MCMEIEILVKRVSKSKNKTEEEIHEEIKIRKLLDSKELK